jgi:hypothetical protein
MLDGGRPCRGALRGRLALLLGSALLVNACGPSDDTHSAGEPTPLTRGQPAPPSHPATKTPAPQREPPTIKPTAGRAKRTVPWKLVAKRDGERQLVLEVMLGGRPCDALTGISVRETRKTATITVRAGRVPGARCADGISAVVGTFRVVAQLVDPLGHRRLRDGSQRQR